MSTKAPGREKIEGDRKILRAQSAMAEAVKAGDPDPEFFADLPFERGRFCLPRLNLAPGKLPESRPGPAGRATLGQNAPLSIPETKRDHRDEIITGVHGHLVFHVSWIRP